jgi:TetR/AcrR family transcriptional regulator, mexJK operon transcriptional repressor
MTSTSRHLKKSTIRRGGRPSREQAERLQERILEVAQGLFFTQGYGSTSIEMIAKKAGISKRTFYHRFADKAVVFRAVVHHVIERLRPPNVDNLFDGQEAEKILCGIAQLVLHAALSPHALALHRLILAEALRFPELALAVHQEGARQEAIKNIADILTNETHAKRLSVKDPVFAAEQFLQMVVSWPQRRALGLGKPMTPHELKAWATDTVDLFLNGCRGHT